MLTPQDINAIAALIKTASEHSQQLFELLQQEQQALVNEDLDTLEGLIEKKLYFSQTLDRLELQRQDIMANAGQLSDQKFMQQFLEKHQTHPAIRSIYNSWEDLLQWLKKSADQNQLNGILLEKQRQRVQRTLNILFEQSHNTSEYDAAGGTTAPEYSRSVGIV
jgi:flagellar biosynthesis/type III secretory pathway chaperone